MFGKILNDLNVLSRSIKILSHLFGSAENTQQDVSNATAYAQIIKNTLASLTNFVKMPFLEVAFPEKG